MKLSLSVGLVASILLMSANSAMADQRHYNQHHNQHQGGGTQVEVTKEVTENGVIIHKTMTKRNGVTYTIDKHIKKGRHGSVDIEKKRNGRSIEKHHHSH